MLLLNAYDVFLESTYVTATSQFQLSWPIFAVRCLVIILPEIGKDLHVGLQHQENIVRFFFDELGPLPIIERMF